MDFDKKDERAAELFFPFLLSSGIMLCFRLKEAESMANEKHLQMIKRGVKAWDRWGTANPEVIPDLREANLGFKNLKSINLTKANLRGAEMLQANLRQASFDHACLVEARLIDADLVGAYLPRADLRGAQLNSAELLFADLNGADLSGAALDGANFDSSDLNGVNLGHATVGNTMFINVDLSEAKGMDTVVHRAPSTISLDTIYRSKGRIPIQFLRGAGVPDNFIEYMHSLVGTAFEFYSCFISYSTKDQEFATRIHADLQDNGVRCWFAPHDVQAGKKLHEQIDSAIRLHERLLLILSPHSIKSEWVKTEIAKARNREIKEGKRVLFPISLKITYKEFKEWECFDADRGKDSAREIREYYIPDFTRWKDHDQYQEEFKKLLRDLKKETVIAAKA